MAEQDNSNAWQQKTIETLALAGLKEQKAARRWGIFFKVLTFLYLFLLLTLAFGWLGDKNGSGPHTALIDINGVIEPGGDVNADSVITSLNEAYENHNTKGIILRFNTPGW
jgi:protease IV